MDVYTFCKEAVNEIIKVALERQSFDNVTGVLIAFNNLTTQEDENKRNGLENNKMKYMNILDDLNQRLSLHKLLSRSRAKNMEKVYSYGANGIGVAHNRIIVENKVGSKVKIKLTPLKK